MSGPGRPILPSRLPAELLAAWLKRHRITVEQIVRGLPCWKLGGKLVPLPIEDLEELAALECPISFAALYLTEERDVVDDDGQVVIPKGAPWLLFPRQQTMARIERDCVFEAASEVGKTRDIMLRTLWRVHTKPGAKVLIATNNESTATEIFNALKFQTSKNPLIGGGVVGTPQKAPFHLIAFGNDSEIQLRLSGSAGEQLRGFHGSDLLGDECALWRSVSCFTEFYRAGLPGSTIRLYSTPNGDRSSAFAGICARAEAIDAAAFELERGARERGEKAEGERGFVRFRIAKSDLPFPFWSESREKHFIALYGSVDAPAYQQNVLGRWGDAVFSIFPMDRLRPCLRRDLADYRVVVCAVDRESRRVGIRAAALSADVRGEREVLLADHTVPLLDGKDLGLELARFFPSTVDWRAPEVFCGGDFGSATDPTELLWVRVDGSTWTDVFRLHLRQADWPVQAQVVAALDHAGGHRVRYGFDNGSAGAALAQVLTQMETFATCPICRADVYFDERLSAFDFARVDDEVDVETGETLPDPNRRNNAGEALPHRASLKEASTRMLERKLAAVQLVIADDAGAGDSSLGAAQLLTNHTSAGLTSRGERRFKATNDHAIDARRMVALAVAAQVRDQGSGFVQPEPAMVSGVARRTVDLLDALPPVDSDSDFGFGFGRVRDGFGNDW